MREEIRILSEKKERRERIFQRIRNENERIEKDIGKKVRGKKIIKIIVGENERDVRIDEKMKEKGLDIREIRKKKVKNGKERMRI